MPASRRSDPGGDLLASAVRQNAAWCDLICTAHGFATHRSEDAWSCGRRTPALHPDAITLRPQVDIERLLAAIDASTGSSVKDSYATVDLSPAGFVVLFEATWLSARGTGSPTSWRPLTTARELAGWHAGWMAAGGVDGVLDPAQLASTDVSFVGAMRGGEVHDGAVLHRFENTIGAGNLFGTDPWPHLLALVDRAAIVVGYEAGDAAAAAITAGATDLGPLRVWHRPPPDVR